MTRPKPTLLVVDDAHANIEILLGLLGPDCTMRVATDGASALESARRNPPDLILLDIMMPGMDGFEVCRRLKAEPSTRDIPVLFLTAMSEPSVEAQGLALGAVDYIYKPFSGAAVKARVFNQLELKAHRDHLGELVAERTADLERTQDAVIAGMALMAEYRDSQTGGHILRTKHFVRTLAEAMARAGAAELTPEMIDLLYRSVPLHDIGKVAIRDSILLKDGRLTPEEFVEIRLHPLLGGEVIRKTEAILGTSSFLRLAREIAESHHEYWDGSGYPCGLKGPAIPLSARLMTIADVYDALISRRSYKDPLSHAEAFRIITEGDGRTRPSHFDPAVLAAFRSVQLQWIEIAGRFAD